MEMGIVIGDIHIVVCGAVITGSGILPCGCDFVDIAALFGVKGVILVRDDLLFNGSVLIPCGISDGAWSHFPSQLYQIAQGIGRCIGVAARYRCIDRFRVLFADHNRHQVFRGTGCLICLGCLYQTIAQGAIPAVSGTNQFKISIRRQ